MSAADRYAEAYRDRGGHPDLCLNQLRTLRNYAEAAWEDSRVLGHPDARHHLSVHLREAIRCIEAAIELEAHFEGSEHGDLPEMFFAQSGDNVGSPPPCTACNGTGAAHPPEVGPCRACDGEGVRRAFA